MHDCTADGKPLACGPSDRAHIREHVLLHAPTLCGPAGRPAVLSGTCGAHHAGPSCERVHRSLPSSCDGVCTAALQSGSLRDPSLADECDARPHEIGRLGGMERAHEELGGTTSNPLSLAPPLEKVSYIASNFDMQPFGAPLSVALTPRHQVHMKILQQLTNCAGSTFPDRCNNGVEETATITSCCKLKMQ